MWACEGLSTQKNIRTPPNISYTPGKSWLYPSAIWYSRPMISIPNLLYTLNTASVYTMVYASCMKSVYCRKSSMKRISFNERTILKWMRRSSISVFKGIFPIFGLPSPIYGWCKPRFSDFQSRFLVNLPKFFFGKKFT